MAEVHRIQLTEQQAAKAIEEIGHLTVGFKGDEIACSHVVNRDGSAPTLDESNVVAKQMMQLPGVDRAVVYKPHTEFIKEKS